jgi:hypothetical protein
LAGAEKPQQKLRILNGPTTRYEFLACTGSFKEQEKV